MILTQHSLLYTALYHHGTLLLFNMYYCADTFRKIGSDSGMEYELDMMTNLCEWHPTTPPQKKNATENTVGDWVILDSKSFFQLRYVFTITSSIQQLADTTNIPRFLQ